jgi:hypothetical protein
MTRVPGSSEVEIAGSLAAMHGASMPQDHWLHGFNFNVEEWGDCDRYETLAICRTLALARAAFTEAIAEEPSGGS